ncbi:hypothetical protein ACFSC4_26045 [Deinococcus malanensis]|uniref:hypothetical protein n=1 Tax=Deinococcus malanensis TaxID=1706855 RepID=UPI003627B899
MARQAYDGAVNQQGHHEALWHARRAGTLFAHDTGDGELEDYLLQQLEMYIAELNGR